MREADLIIYIRLAVWSVYPVKVMQQLTHRWLLRNHPAGHVVVMQQQQQQHRTHIPVRFVIRVVVVVVVVGVVVVVVVVVHAPPRV